MWFSRAQLLFNCVYCLLSLDFSRREVALLGQTCLYVCLSNVRECNADEYYLGSWSRARHSLGSDRAIMDPRTDSVGCFFFVGASNSCFDSLNDFACVGEFWRLTKRDHIFQSHLPIAREIGKKAATVHRKTRNGPSSRILCKSKSKKMSNTDTSNFLAVANFCPYRNRGCNQFSNCAHLRVDNHLQQNPWCDPPNKERLWFENSILLVETTSEETHWHIKEEHEVDNNQDQLNQNLHECDPESLKSYHIIATVPRLRFWSTSTKNLSEKSTIVFPALFQLRKRSGEEWIFGKLRVIDPENQRREL